MPINSPQKCGDIKLLETLLLIYYTINVVVTLESRWNENKRKGKIMFHNLIFLQFIYLMSEKKNLQKQ